MKNLYRVPVLRLQRLETEQPTSFRFRNRFGGESQPFAPRLFGVAMVRKGAASRRGKNGAWERGQQTNLEYCFLHCLTGSPPEYSPLIFRMDNRFTAVSSGHQALVSCFRSPHDEDALSGRLRGKEVVKL